MRVDETDIRLAISLSRCFVDVMRPPILESGEVRNVEKLLVLELRLGALFFRDGFPKLQHACESWVEFACHDAFPWSVHPKEILVDRGRLEWFQRLHVQICHEKFDYIFKYKPFLN